MTSFVVVLPNKPVGAWQGLLQKPVQATHRLVAGLILCAGLWQACHRPMENEPDYNRLTAGLWQACFKYYMPVWQACHRPVNYADLSQACNRPVNLYHNHGDMGVIFMIIIGTTTRTNNNQVNTCSNFGCLNSDKPVAGL